jgi:hypothetical protein
LAVVAVIGVIFIVYTVVTRRYSRGAETKSI